MRHILHNTEPASFYRWRQQNPNANWNNFLRPHSQHLAVYTELRKTLIDQQKKMCCYCEVALKEDTDAHVEHLQDQDNYPKETFNFNNLLASCRHNDCCGHKKGNSYFTEMVSPLDNNCESRFTYTGNGKIIPFNELDIHAQKTIRLLGLNCKRLSPSLRVMRECLKKSV
ncbi:MAG: TIGR02646 family protein [Clostridiales bacterium]|nr:TIGR02646 family protein [Clostridiales bacterium]